MDLYRAIFGRYYEFDAGKDPVLRLNDTQRDRVHRVLEKIRTGTYVLQDAACTCGETDAGILIAKKDRYGLPVETRLCRGCGVLRTSPRFDSGSLVRFYEDDFRPMYDPGFGGDAPDLPRLFGAEALRGRFVRDFVRPYTGKRQGPVVFDVGCGLGGVLLPFVEDGWTGYGCDLDGESLAYGRTRGLTLVKGRLQDLAGKYGEADLIVMSHVLEHIESPPEFLAEVNRALKEDGLLYIELPGVFHIHRAYGDIMAFLQNAHLYHFSLKTLTDLATGKGFRLVRGSEHVHALFRKDGGSRGPPRGSAGYYYIKILIYLMGIAVAYRVVHMKGVQTIYRKLSRYLPVFSVERNQAG